MNQRHKVLRLLGPALILVVALTGLIAMHRDVRTNLYYPPGEDQDSYLKDGQKFAEQGLVTWRTPIYSIWMGGFYLLGSRNLETAFWAEKYVSVFLFAFLCGWLGWTIFRTPGLLMAPWALAAKYLVRESNGTHALATSIAI